MTTAQGNQNWFKTLGSSTLTTPVAGDGMIYVVDDSQTLHALTMATGKSVWTHPAAGGDFGPALSGDTVYVSTGVKVQAVNARTGTPVWTFAPPTPAGLTSTPAVADGLVFTGSTGKNLYAIRA
jgi:outer membrane protein assembly factor BamB